MKKVFYFFAIAALACATACQREAIPESVISETEGTFTFTSLKPVLEDENPTKTEWTGETIQWSKDDQIRMAYTVAGVWQGASNENTTPRLYASNKLTEATEIAEFTVNSNFTSTATGAHIFYGLYPGTLSASDFSSAPKAAITIPAEQKPAADSFDSAADVMVGVSEELENKPSDGETVLMTWTRLVAHADLTIKNLTINEGETIDNVTLTAQDGADLVGMHNLNLVTGEVSDAQGTTNEIVIKADNLTYTNKTIKVWASMLPATITELTVTVETDKALYVRSFTGITREFKKNMRNTMNIGMTSAVRTEKAQNLEDYEELFSDSLGDFTIKNSEIGSLSYVWSYDNGYHYAKASAYVSGAAHATISYLISPELTIGSNKSKLSFDQAANKFNGAAVSDYLTVVVIEGENETPLTLDVVPNGSSWTFVTSTASLSSFIGKTVKIGFKYTSTDNVAGTWEVKNFKVTDVMAAEAPTEYTITVEESENGLVSASTDKATEGTEVTLTIAPESGYALDELSVVDAENRPVTVTGDKFTMPASNVTVLATFKELTGTVYDFTWDLTKSSYSSSSDEQVMWVNDNVTMSANKADASTPTNNYLPPTQNSTRFYKSSTLSFTPADKVTITKVEYTATTSSYASALATSTWTNASATVDGTLVTIVPADGSKVFSATVGATTGASAVKVYYIGGVPVIETEYDIIINQASNGTVTASAAKATKGTEITLTITPSAGYELDALTVVDSNNNAVSVSDNKFSMPESDVTVSATFKEKVVTGTTSATIKFGTNEVKINAASVTGKDDQENTWTIATEGTTSFTANAAYYQVGSSSKPATSITFTTTLPETVTKVDNLSIKLGGFSGTAGDVTLNVGSTTIGSGSLNATNDVTVSSTSSADGRTITITVANISKGVKVYYITAEYE